MGVIFDLLVYSFTPSHTLKLSHIDRLFSMDTSAHRHAYVWLVTVVNLIKNPDQLKPNQTWLDHSSNWEVFGSFLRAVDKVQSKLFSLAYRAAHDLILAFLRLIYHSTFAWVTPYMEQHFSPMCQRSLGTSPWNSFPLIHLKSLLILKASLRFSLVQLLWVVSVFVHTWSVFALWLFSCLFCCELFEGKRFWSFFCLHCSNNLSMFVEWRTLLGLYRQRH